MARPHPYAFAHVLVPQLVGRRPAAVRRELADPVLAHELLQYMWEKAAEGLVPAERLPARDLRLSWHEVAGRTTALLHLPAPQASGEAHFAALVYEEEADDDPAADDLPEAVAAQRPRYFLLEAALGRSSDEAGTPTVLGEWRGDVHRHFGRGPAAGRPDSAQAFLRALAPVLGPLPGAGVAFMRIVR